MVRTYKRKIQSTRQGKNFQPYNSYSKESLEKALADIEKGSTLVAASKKYGIPLTTLSRKKRGLNNTQATAGHPLLFDSEEESIFVSYIKVMSEWGFPMDTVDLRVLTQRYLAKIGRHVQGLKDNMPGRDWALSFLNRHKQELSLRQSSNISTSRAEIDHVIINKFFDNYTELVTEDITPDRIINYDETNLTDDPGSKKFICKRGSKCPERIINSTKSAISLMFAGCADGTILPPYVVYKAEHLWDSWVTGGPPNTRYNRAKSGWFDSVCFEDWFVSVVIPYVRNKEGQKLIIGDNLSSHFSAKVLDLCATHQIKFICFPPKSTHILQPLDVAFYAPMKHYWRQILTDWKQKGGRRSKTLSKQIFPQLFLKLHRKLTDNDSGKRNIVSGFDKCGLYPVNRQRPLERLPKKPTDANEVDQNVSTVVIEMLSELREPLENKSQKKRKKKLAVSPGKSIGVDDLTNSNTLSKSVISTKKSISKSNKEKVKSCRLNKPKPSTSRKRSISSSSESSVDMSIHSEIDDEVSSENIDFEDPADSHEEVMCSTRNEPESDKENVRSSNITKQDDLKPSTSRKRHTSTSERSVDMSTNSDSDDFEDPTDLHINDYALVRYVKDTSVKYYIGEIIGMTSTVYEVEYFNAYKNTLKGLRFSRPKKPNKDKISKKLVMKKVQLIETQDNVYLLFDSTDSVYFAN